MRTAISVVLRVLAVLMMVFVVFGVLTFLGGTFGIIELALLLLLAAGAAIWLTRRKSPTDG